MAHNVCVYAMRKSLYLKIEFQKPCKTMKTMKTMKNKSKKLILTESDLIKVIIMSREISSIDCTIDLDNDALQSNLEDFSMRYTIN